MEDRGRIFTRRRNLSCTIKTYNILGEMGFCKDYDKIRAYCLKEAHPYEDPYFPADDGSLYFSDSTRLTGNQPRIEWKRPQDLEWAPEFCRSIPSRCDVIQGEISNCWLAAAVTHLADNPELFHYVIPKGQSFDDSGVIRINLWYFGHQTEIVMDDRLPTRRGRLIYMHGEKPSREDNAVYWSAYVEKAFAILAGCYEALHGGHPGNAFRSLFDNFPDSVCLEEHTERQLAEIISKAQQRKAIMTCTTASDDERALRTPDGLYSGHAYSVLGFHWLSDLVDNPVDNLQLARLRNPWGTDEIQWNGAWSNESPEWQVYGQKLAPNVGGEFWIDIADFHKHMSHLQVCDARLFLDFNIWRNWRVCELWSQWKKDWYKQQFFFEVKKKPGWSNFPAIIGLTQQPKIDPGRPVEYLNIGFSLWKLHGVESCSRHLLPGDFFLTNEPILSVMAQNLPEVHARTTLEPGIYCVLAYKSPMEPRPQENFLLRLYIEKSSNDEDTDSDDSGLDDCGTSDGEDSGCEEY